MKHPNFSKIRTHTLRGRRFDLRWRCPAKGLPKGKYRGACSDPDDRYSGENELYIWTRQPDKDILGTVIHEVLHGIVPSLKEEIVEDFEHDLMRLLNRMGLRDNLFEPK